MSELRWVRGLLWVVVLASGACRGQRWDVGAGMTMTQERVARALGDSLPAASAAESTLALPVLTQPDRTRPCCVFGMDLRLRFQSMKIAGYRNGNILSPDALGHHKYNAGALSFDANERIFEAEKNGLVYACRGGFVDVSHVRDNADLTLYLALRIAHLLPAGGRFELPGDGAARTITIQPVAEQVFARQGRLEVAAALASSIAFRLSIWHELATWWGWGSVAGFSEQISAFSLEDLYSNVLGIRIAAAIIVDHGFSSRDGFDRNMDAWIAAALRQLGAQPVTLGRDVMKSLDGIWWDSKLIVPDVKAVKRRAFPTGNKVSPWRAELAPAALPPQLGEACKQAPALPLEIDSKLGALELEHGYAITWRPERWAGPSFPFPHHGAERRVDNDELDELVLSTREAMRAVLGADFDRPAP